MLKLWENYFFGFDILFVDLTFELWYLSLNLFLINKFLRILGLLVLDNNLSGTILKNEKTAKKQDFNI